MIRMHTTFYLFSKNTPLLAFSFENGGQVNIHKIFKEHQRLLPFVLQAENLVDIFPNWLSHRFTPSGRWLMQVLKQYGVARDFSSILQMTCALSLTDTFWIHDGSKKWEEENLFINDFSEEMANIAITRGIAPENLRFFGRSPEYTSEGALRKCWTRRGDKLLLLKADDSVPHEQVNQASAEWLAWKVAEFFGFNAIPYDLEMYQHRNGRCECVSACEIFTSQDIGYVPASECLTFMGISKTQLSDLALETPESQSAIGNAMGKDVYADMMLLDAVIGNTDRHMGNYGMLFDTNTGEILSMAPIFDNGMSFMARLDKSDKTEEELYSRWTRGCVMSFDAMARLFVRERHRESLEHLLEFSFPESPFLSVESLDRAGRFLHRRAAIALQCLDQRPEQFLSSTDSDTAEYLSPKW